MTEPHDYVKLPGYDGGGCALCGREKEGHPKWNLEEEALVLFAFATAPALTGEQRFEECKKALQSAYNAGFAEA